ncbi:DoxX family membrane protein [Streptomyces sp. NPDC051909]|uniref:DoxX family membrane protein n=1 Tax=Streptomyces sp. NPDC051909 TaxID=3154944 RepID=UPI00344ADAD8
MSVDTRTPRPGFDDQPPLSMVKVDSDPAQVIVNHASFRVRLAPAGQPKFAANPRIAALAGAAGMTGVAAGGAAGAGRRRPVVWSGKAAPGATGLLQAVRDTSGPGRPGGVSTLEPTTQTIPRIDDTMPTPVVPPAPAAPLLPPMRRAEGAYDEVYEIGPDGYGDQGADPDARGAHRHGPAWTSAAAAAGVRHAYYPGRRMNLGVVLLPLRVFLGFISIYAGMGKLCDPVYFDGGERGSMVKWLNSLHPWALAEPLRDFALQHPVGAGLTVAFLQVVVGVLTVLGLWQRVAAVVGGLLSAALLLTVSWKTVPVYDSADIIYLAAWSPLIIAGAPVYSVDGRLAGEAWRTLGPRSELWELRRRVLRRGTIVAAVVVGLTLLIGSMLGGAVRSTTMVTVPGPNEDPVNHLPGEPLPAEPGTSSPSRKAPKSPRPTATSGASGTKEPTKEATPSESARETTRTQERTPSASTSTRSPSQTRTSSPSSSTSDSTSGGTSGTPTSGSTTGGTSDGGSTSGGARNPIGGLLG